MSAKNLNAILHLFIIAVLMATFSWIGLAEHTWLKSDTLDHLPQHEITVNQLPSSVLLAVKVLNSTSAVDSKRVGPGGSISKNYKAFKQIIDHPAAESAFEYLLNSEHAEAKIYALHGLKQINQSRYDQLIPFFQNSQMEVHTSSGCSGDFKTVVDSLEFITKVHPDINIK